MKTSWANRHPECPSELALDRLSAGEVDAAEQGAIRAHADTCERCRARINFRERGFDAFANLDPDRMVASITARVAGPAEAAPQPAAPVVPLAARRRPSKWAVPIALAASIAAAVFFIGRPAGDQDSVQLKGPLTLRVYREREGQVAEVSSGDRFRAGDRLRFKSKLDPTAGEIMVVGTEGRDRLFVYYPSDGSKTSSRPQIQDDGALAGAVELDAHQGEEWLHLVWCPRHFSLNELSAGEAAKDLRSPSGCRSTSFMLEKE